jgi:hypothetical protein
MTVLARTRTPKPVSGTCRWVRRIAYPLPGILEINGTEYTVVPLHNQPAEEGAPVVGYRLVKPDGRTFYDVSKDCWSCDCPDATYCPRPGGCKHARALRTALSQPAPAPVPRPTPAGPWKPSRIEAPIV